MIVIDALRHKPHPTHLECRAGAGSGGAGSTAQTLFTHICHDLATERGGRSAAGVGIAYDGLKMEICRVNRLFFAALVAFR